MLYVTSYSCKCHIVVFLVVEMGAYQYFERTDSPFNKNTRTK
jgi:hypothetical protein